MRILALDAATEACSVALYDGAQMLGRSEEMPRGHTERLLRMVEEVLSEADWPLTSLDGMAAGIGPGSFTGVRVGVAVAQGLAFGAGLAIAPVSSLEALAWKALQLDPVPPDTACAQAALACLDARMGEVYFGCFAPEAARGVIAISALQVGPSSSVRLPAGAAAKIYQGIGRGFRAYPELGRLPGVTLRCGADVALPDAREIADLGARRLAAGEGLDPADLMPLYIRDKVALTDAERDAAGRH